MIKTLFISELDIPTCLEHRATGIPFAVVGNRSQIPLFIGVPCGIDVEANPLEAIHQARVRLDALEVEIRNTRQDKSLD